MPYEIDTKTPHPSRGQGVYLELLEKLKPGQSIKTKDKKVVARVSAGLRKALRSQGSDAHYRVSQRMNMDDGYHRVYILARPQKLKMADLPGRKIRNLKG